MKAHLYLSGLNFYTFNFYQLRKILVLIVLAQFLCTSLWFAGNAILPDLTITLGLRADAISGITSGVQLGFILGTLSFAILTIPDRFSPSRVFMISAFLASLSNLAILVSDIGYHEVLVLRFFTGFFLAGIYPVGMKIASDYFDKGLGASLGFLVGALVLGTAFPHLSRAFFDEIAWENVIYSTSAVAIIGGLTIGFLVPDGPYRQQGKGFQWQAFFLVFRMPSVRRPAFGYFGHMWELYAFWAFTPLLITSHPQAIGISQQEISLWSFLIIAAGSLACVVGGLLSGRFGAKKVAQAALFGSFLCCCLVPFALLYFSFYHFLGFLVIWAILVIADSPMFSTLVAQAAPGDQKGTALTIVNCLGFAITIVSIQFLGFLIDKSQAPFAFSILGIGPLLGLLAFRRA